MQVIKSTLSKHCTVELAGNWTRGLMVIDKLGILKKPDNVILIKELDEEMSKNIMLWAIGGIKTYV